jgi:serine/threonine-protein kinase HipA
MTESIEVHIDLNGETRPVGLCRYIAKRSSRTSVFEYKDEWSEAEHAFAIDPENLPLRAGIFPRQSNKSALPGAMRDTAPGRWGQQLIRRAFRKAGKERTLSEIDYLLAINDVTRIGALRYKRPDEATFDHDIGRNRVPPLVRLPALVNAADAIQTNTETAEDLKLLLDEGSPLGGARPKSAVQDNDGSLAIAKFPKADDDRSIPHGEVLAMTLASMAGLNVAPARLENVAGRPVSIITRFDRNGELRVPFVSAMTMLGLDDGDEATYTDIAEVIRKHSSEPTKDLYELFGRVVFNVLISNLDDHLRNHGFLYDGNGRWRLSPAYDLNPVPIEEKVRELTTWISEDGPDASLDLARNAAKYFALKNAQADAIIKQQEAVVASWSKTASRLGMSAADTAAYASAFSAGGRH